MKDVAVSTVTDSTAVLPNLDTIIRGLLYVYIFSLPFKHLLFVERNGFIILVVLLLVWCVVNQRHFFSRTPIDVPLIAFVAWIAVTIPFATFPGYSAKEFAKLLQQGMIFYAIVYFFKDGLYRTHLVWVLLGSLSIVSAYGIFQFADLIGMQGKEGGLTLVASVMPGEVWLTTYLVMLIPLGLAFSFIERKPLAKICYAGSTGIATVCLLLTFSRAGALAFLCELWVFVLLLRHKNALLTAAASTAGVALGGVLLFLYIDAGRSALDVIPGTGIPGTKVTTSSMIHRKDIWEFALSKIPEHPVLGIGYGKDNFRLVFGQFQEKVQPRHSPVLQAGTHNIFIDLALGVGILGLLFFIWLIQRIAFIALTTFQKTEAPLDVAVSLGVGVSVIGMVIRLFFDHMLIGTLAILFWILVAMAMLAHSATDRTQTQRA